jgi:branched-chain amino acid transport system ATP-binding protein
LTTPAGGQAPSPAALELRNVVAAYGRRAVLHEVSLDVPRGNVVALVGSNGAGKSTLLRVASGLRPLIGGDVLIDGRSAARARAFERSRAGLCLIPEGRGVFPSLTVRENLVLDVMPGSKHRDFERAFGLFPVLKDRLRQKAGSMSGGEQRMLALARCFLADPKVVLVDELSTGLAPRVIETLFAALALLADEGVGLLMAEQYAARAHAFADKVYVLRQGRIRLVAAGSGLDPGELDVPFDNADGV